MAIVGIVQEETGTEALPMNREVVQPLWATREFVEMTISKVIAMRFSIPRVSTKSALR